MTAQRREVERIVPGRGHPARLPMTSAIETHQAEGAAERVDLRVPHFEIERPAVHEHDRRTFSLVTIAQAGAVGAEVTVGGTCAWDGGRARKHRADCHGGAKKFSLFRLRARRGTVKRARPAR